MGKRENNQLGREKAFRAARLAIGDKISMSAAAEREGSNRSSVQEAHTILTLGTDDEIAAVENGTASMGPTTRAIRARTTAEERKTLARAPVFGPSVMANREFDAEIWGMLRAALDALTALPVPEDVSAIVKKNAMRTEYVSRKVLTAHTWLEEFVNAWTR